MIKQERFFRYKQKNNQSRVNFNNVFMTSYFPKIIRKGAFICLKASKNRFVNKARKVTPPHTKFIFKSFYKIFGQNSTRTSQFCSRVQPFLIRIKMKFLSNFSRKIMIKQEEFLHEKCIKLINILTNSLVGNQVLQMHFGL